jgi:hypothetical protein
MALVDVDLNHRTSSDPISYTTNFPLTESPISEGGKWRSALAIGLDWTDVVSSGGVAYGTQSGGSPSGPPYDDSVACLSGFPPNHSASQTININAAGDVGFYHESEVWVRTSITAHSVTGYEMAYAWDGQYCGIAAWNGPLNDYTVLNDGTPTGALVTGDILLGTVVGNTISFYRNGVLVAQAVDTRFSGHAQWTAGNPGIGFWRRGGSGAPRLRASHYEAFSL